MSDRNLRNLAGCAVPQEALFDHHQIRHVRLRVAAVIAGILCSSRQFLEEVDIVLHVVRQSTQLAFQMVPERVDDASRRQQHCMIAAGGHLNNHRVQFHLDGTGVRQQIASAQLTVLVAAEGKYVAVRAQGDRVMESAGDLDDGTA